MNCFPIMVFSFQSISFKLDLRRYSCQNLSLVDEIWDSFPSKVKIMRGNLWSSIQRLQTPPPPPPPHSLTLLFFLTTRSVCSTGKAQERNEKAEINPRIGIETRTLSRYFPRCPKYIQPQSNSSTMCQVLLVSGPSGQGI